MNNKIKNFSDLFAWQESHKLALVVYDSTKLFPNDEKFGLVSQMRRCAVSIPSNIAEGFGRNTAKDKAQFFTISRGSLLELQSQILIAKDLGYLDPEEAQKLYEQSVKASKLISGLIKTVIDK